MRELAPRPARERSEQPCATVDDLRVAAYRIPREGGPESDGTLVWDSTTLVLVELDAGGETGIGFTYAAKSAADIVNDMLRHVVLRKDVSSHGALWTEMLAAVRNFGGEGITAAARGPEQPFGRCDHPAMP